MSSNVALFRPSSDWSIYQAQATPCVDCVSCVYTTIASRWNTMAAGFVPLFSFNENNKTIKLGRVLRSLLHPCTCQVAAT